MNRRLLYLLCSLISILVVASCGTPDYPGYKHKPYTIRGKRYHPIHPHHAVGIKHRGGASWYDERRFFSSGTTALGEPFRAGAMAGAHKTLPIPCVVKVTNLKNGRKAVIRLNDRGPFIDGRILDVTPKVARKLGFYKQGLTDVEIKVISVGDGKHKITRRKR